MDKQQVISKIAEYYHITRNIDFAKFFNIMPQNAISWLKDGRYNIYEVYQRCPDISPEWLLSLGEKGDMLRQERDQDQKEETPLDKILDKTLDCLAVEQANLKKVLENTELMLKAVGVKQSEKNTEM